MPFESISISIQPNLFFVLLGAIFLFAYSYFVYKYTIPRVPSYVKIILIALRSLAIILILCLIFEPIITLTRKKIIVPKIFLFNDNSNSIAAKDSLKRLDENIALLENLETLGKEHVELFTFGLKPKHISFDSLNRIKYNEPITNFSKAVSLLKNSEENISAAVIISDGIITDGSNPIYEAEKLQFPIFTIGIGDTAAQKDILVKDVLFNQYIYADNQTEIEALIWQTGFNKNIVRASLFEEDKLIQTKDVELNESGLTKVKFDYTPTRADEKKLRISISQLNGESNFSNNQKTFFVNVLKNKIKVALISGSPSPDLSVISQALNNDKNIEVKKIIQVSANKFWDNPKSTDIDSANILFLVDFPLSNTPQNFVDQVFSSIELKSKPYFILLSHNTDLRRLRNYEKVLPFSFKNITDNYVQIQPSLFSSTITSIFSNSAFQNEWINLPPLTKSASDFIPKPGSDVLVKGTIRNFSSNEPIIVTSNIGNQRSVAILAGDIWRWQLLAAEKNPLFFQNFINNISKWLNAAGSQQQFFVKTSKKIYPSGDIVEFTAELYDQTFSPIDSAKINLIVYHENQKFQLSFNKVRAGLFQTSLALSKEGNYYYEAEAHFNGTVLKSSKGRFSVGEINIEKLNTCMDINFLKQLANSNNGEFYFINSSAHLKERLKELLASLTKEKIILYEINLRTDKYIMLIIIFLLGLEWFIRKRMGMI